MRRAFLCLVFTGVVPRAVLPQRAAATADLNVRSGQSTRSKILGHLTAGDTVSLVSPMKRSGYYHVERGQLTGWAYSRYLQLISGSATANTTSAQPKNKPPATTLSTHVSTTAVGKPGSSSQKGCGDHLWQHVYNPQRLLVKADCVTVTGTIVDATNGKQSDGARHEADGDTHAWLKLDPEYQDMLDAGNSSDESGNLVFEIVCHYTVKQADAKPACSGYADHTKIPPVGTHVEITGTYVEDTNHGQWNEIHPVSKIVVKP